MENKIYYVSGTISPEYCGIKVKQFEFLEKNKTLLITGENIYKNKNLKKTILLKLDTIMRQDIYSFISIGCWCFLEDMNEAKQKVKDHLEFELNHRETAVEKMVANFKNNNYNKRQKARKLIRAFRCKMKYE